jgi:transposase
MEKITTVGIDLAKRVFVLHGVDAMGRVVLKKTVRREQLMELVAGLPPCRIGMEACAGAHEWARRFAELGHEVKLMAAKFVIPYRKNGKNDGNDAEAICEAVAVLICALYRLSQPSSRRCWHCTVRARDLSPSAPPSSTVSGHC